MCNTACGTSAGIFGLPLLCHSAAGASAEPPQEWNGACGECVDRSASLAATSYSPTTNCCAANIHSIISCMLSLSLFVCISVSSDLLSLGQSSPLPPSRTPSRTPCLRPAGRRKCPTSPRPPQLPPTPTMIARDGRRRSGCRRCCCCLQSRAVGLTVAESFSSSRGSWLLSLPATAPSAAGGMPRASARPGGEEPQKWPSCASGPGALARERISLPRLAKVTRSRSRSLSRSLPPLRTLFLSLSLSLCLYATPPASSSAVGNRGIVNIGRHCQQQDDKKTPPEDAGRERDGELHPTGRGCTARAANAPKSHASRIVAEMKPPVEMDLEDLAVRHGG